MQPLDSPRDQLPQGRTIHALLLTYKLSLEAEGKHRVTVPMLNRCACYTSWDQTVDALCSLQLLCNTLVCYPDLGGFRQGLELCVALKTTPLSTCLVTLMLLA